MIDLIGSMVQVFATYSVALQGVHSLQFYLVFPARDLRILVLTIAKTKNQFRTYLAQPSIL